MLVKDAKQKENNHFKRLSKILLGKSFNYFSQTMSAQTEEQRITEIIDEINESWLFQKFDKIATHLHEEVVLVQRDFEDAIIGKETYIEAYQEFTQHAAVNRYRADKVHVFCSDEVANAHYQFRIEYETAEEVVQEKGIDVFTFKKVKGEWKVIWRSVANVKVLRADKSVENKD